MKLFGIEIRRVPQIAVRAAREVWVTVDGDRVTIGEMVESHVKHSLAMILRAVRAGKPVRLLSNGQMYFGEDLEVGEQRLRGIDALWECEWPWGEDR